MVKMVKSAQGQEIDWDLLKIQTQVNKNVAEPVEAVDQVSMATRRQQRARLDAAKKLLDQATQQAPQSTVVAAVEEPQQVTTTKKGKYNAGTD
jgi:hypothetical protein